MNIKNKTYGGLVLLSLLLALLCCPAVSAVQWDTDLEPGTVSAIDPDETNYTVFAKMSKSSNSISSTLMLAGIAFAGVGVAGIIGLIIWQVSTRDRGDGDDRDDIFDEIEQAEIRNRKMRTAEQQTSARRESAERAPAMQAKDTAPLVPDLGGYTGERPLVPSTPVAMQPDTGARPAVKPQMPQQRTAPRTAQPQQRTAPRTAQPQQRTAPQKFDLDDILREVRENKTQKD